MEKYHATVDAHTTDSTTIVVEADNDSEAYDKIEEQANEMFLDHDSVEIGDVFAGDGTEGEISNVEDEGLIFIKDNQEDQPELDHCCGGSCHNED